MDDEALLPIRVGVGHCTENVNYVMPEQTLSSSAPYGVRESTERVGSKRGEVVVIPEHL